MDQWPCVRILEAQHQSFTLDYQSAKDAAMAVIHFTLSFVHRNYCSSACTQSF